MRTFFSRHTDFVRKRGVIVPRSAELSSVSCLDNMPAHLHQRLIGFAPGLPLYAFATNCCDAFCTPGEILAGTCYKKADLWPVGTGPGLSRRIMLYAFDAGTCRSARGNRVVLVYDDGDGKWHGSLALRGGSLALTFEILTGDIDAPGKFQLSWTGCQTGSVTAPAACFDPTIISFPQVEFGVCCDCPAPDTSTDTPGQISFFVAGNCRRPRWTRNVGFRAGPTPAYAKPKDCRWDQTDEATCGSMTCPVMLSFTHADSACACLDGDYLAAYASGGWEALGIGRCAPASATMTCMNAGRDAQGRPLVTLQVVVTCGATNSGTGSKTILAADLEDLDEIIPVTMTDPGAGTCTDCLWHWNQMAGVWDLISGCSGASCGTCDPNPSSPPVGPYYDGQPHSEPCPVGGGAACCVGVTNVRATRA